MQNQTLMKHVHLANKGDPSVISIKESPIPKLKENEVLIRIKASGLNRADTEQRKGDYPVPEGASQILGLEASGYLCSPDGTPDESKRVMALLTGGGCAQYAAVPKSQVIDVPENLSLEEAGGLPEVWITAFLLLELAQIKEGDRVLIYGGASGVGIAAIQLVKLFKGISIVTVSTEEKIEFTKRVGADFAINYKKEENLAKAVMDATEGKGINIILDCIGASFFQLGLDVCAIDAHWILYGLMSGARVPNLNLGDLFKKRISLISSTLRSRSKDFKASLVERFKKTVMPHFESGKLKISIEKVVKVDWTDATPVQEAHKLMESNSNAGKIIFSLE